MRKILFDIGHPAKVHLYRNLIFFLKEKGYKVFVTTKDTSAVKNLLSKYLIDYINLGAKKDNLWLKFILQLKYSYKVFLLAKKEKINIGIGSINVGHAGLFSRIKAVSFDDDDLSVQPFYKYFALPFISSRIIPECIQEESRGKKIIKYSGYHELAYLHPNRFSPDCKVLEELGLKPGDPFFVLRFNAFKAHHDTGINGLSLKQKLELITVLRNYGKILITTERQIEPELEEYQLKISPEKIHSLLAYATMFVGDSQTMTSEAAVLGIPAVKCNSIAGKLSIPNELEEKYELCYSYLPQEFGACLTHVKELLAMPNLREEWTHRKNRMLSDKIDVTAFMIWFVENYPQSVSILKSNPDYQLQFK